MSEVVKQNEIFISYPLEEFLKYQDVNNTMPLNLTVLCKDRGCKIYFRDSILKDVKNIIDNFRAGINPNDTAFLGSIREYLNIINNKNYVQYIDLLKKINYTSNGHFDILTNELILRAMMDMIAVKNISLPDGQKSPSEIYADIALEFSSFFIKDNNIDIKFINKLMETCQKYFLDFTDITKPLDKNNQYRVDNFKGFINFLGLLFNRDILSHKITISCITKLKDLMFNIEWGQIESENIHDGYIKFLNQILITYEKKIKKQSTDLSYLESLEKIHIEISNLNDKYKKLRKFPMLIHKELENRFKKLVKHEVAKL
jgi:hypothetical protein